MRDEVQSIVDRINHAHAIPDRPAVQYLHRACPPTEVAALYVAADVMLVTSLRDGMNLVAKEFIACHPNNGALILSMFAGASDELGANAYLVNPYDINNMKAAMRRALCAPPGIQEQRMHRLHRVIEHHDNRSWAASFLAALTGQPDMTSSIPLCPTASTQPERVHATMPRPPAAQLATAPAARRSPPQSEDRPPRPATTSPAELP